MSITEWLSNPTDYQLGLDILRHNFPNHPINFLHKVPFSSFNHRLLLQTMEQLAEQVPDNPIQPLPHAVSQPVVSPDLAALIERRKYTYKQAGLLHATSLKSKNPEERREAALEIVSLMRENQDCWNRIKFYEKHQRLPGKSLFEVQLKELPVTELIKLRNNNRSYISRNRKKLSSLKADKKEKLKNAMEARRLQNESIELILNGTI